MTSTLKAYLRELPDTLTTQKLYAQWEKTVLIKDVGERCEDLN